MATKKKSNEGKVKVSKLKVKRDKVEELTDRKAKLVRGGVEYRQQPKKPDIVIS